MADADPGTGGPLPAYFVAWRDAWGPQAADWTPIYYLNQQAALPAVLAAGTLFHPATTEYRGAVFLTERFRASTVDSWFERYPGEPSRIESVVNRWVLYDLFAACDTGPYEDALPVLAADLGACWQGVLSLRYPDRVVRVEVHDGSDPADYGPAVTFWTEAVAGPASGAATG